MYSSLRPSIVYIILYEVQDNKIKKNQSEYCLFLQHGPSITTAKMQNVFKRYREMPKTIKNVQPQIQQSFSFSSVKNYIYIYVVYMLLFCTSYNLYKIFIQVITCITPSYKL